MRNSNILKKYGYVEIEDKKSHKLRGVFSKATIVKPKKYSFERADEKV